MKVCPKCSTEKDESEFYRINKSKVHSFCKLCFNEYCIERWRNRKINAIRQLGGRCVDCGFIFNETNFPVCEFHHLEPKNKDFDWNRLRLRSEKILQEELKKCIILCANCHRIRHWCI